MTDKLMQQINEAKDSKELYAIKVEWLGKKGILTQQLQDLRNLSGEEKAAKGKELNLFKNAAEQAFLEKESFLKKQELSAKLASEKIDITLPSKKQKSGGLHPLTIVREQIIDAFIGLGFSVSDGPEIEDDFHCFEALNIPKNHPARDMQDTFYFSDNILLRTHTSTTQIRTMLTQKPPIKVLCPGKVYRSDDDATHSPMFSQVEGLVVDKNVTLCDLKGILDEFAKKLFSQDTVTRFRPSYFPFTEPSVEVDVSCIFCGGSGCRLCKHTGYIEILGSGIVNRNVFTACGIDPDEYRGFAFGMGIERITMLKFGIPDMRLLFENDIRFLKQFKNKN